MVQGNEESNENRDNIEVDRETFVTLAKLGCTDVVLRSPSGFFRQKDGLAMGIQAAPMLANIWMSSFEDSIKEDASMFAGYVDDILVDVEESEINNRLTKINNAQKQHIFKQKKEK